MSDRMKGWYMVVRQRASCLWHVIYAFLETHLVTHILRSKIKMSAFSTLTFQMAELGYSLEVET